MGRQPAKEQPKSTRSHNRLEAVLEAAARLFATKGYKATTMRDIASATGMQPGSLYYHFESKQELLLEIYRQAVGGIQQQLDDATCEVDDPWERFDAAVVRHVETVLDRSHYAKVMIGVLPDDAPDIREELAMLRDGYESSFIDIIDDLPLAEDIDKKLFRLTVLGTLNSTQLWYREGNYTPSEVGHNVARFLRQPLE